MLGRLSEQDRLRQAKKEDLDRLLGHRYQDRTTSRQAADRREVEYLLQRSQLIGDPNLLSKARSRLAETSQKLLRRANQLLGRKDQTPLGDFVKDTRRVGSPKRQLIHNQ